MESMAMLHGGSPPKLPSYTPPSTFSPIALRPRLSLRKSPITWLANGSASVSFGLTRNDKFLAHCRSVRSGEMHSNAKQDPWKSLLNLVPAKVDNNSQLSTIVSIKNEALKLVMDEQYDVAECLMKSLTNRGGTNDDAAYEARVAYVQFLIYLDEYNKALEFLEKEGNFPKSASSDARPCLYKAVVHAMLDKDDAKESWKPYLETLNNGNVYGKTNTDPEVFLIDAKAPLKSLLSLKPTKVEEDSFSNIIHTKALKEVVNREYDTAEFLMKGLWEKERDAEKHEEAYEAQMAYIQILIHLDKYKEALKCLEEDNNFFVQSDGRPCLYMAIVHTVLGNHGEARNLWDAFIENFGNKYPSSTP